MSHKTLKIIKGLVNLTLTGKTTRQQVLDNCKLSKNELRLFDFGIGYSINSDVIAENY